MASEERLRNLLSDLGKATLRGVRKCPKCGTYNGSRVIYCKNIKCDAVFKLGEHGEKRKLSTEAYKLITGSTTQIFSVRIRDKDPDHRGFVQLPVLKLNTNSDSPICVPQSSALCFVDNCKKHFNNSVNNNEKNVSELSTKSCQHVQAALRCYAEAQPLTLRNSVLSSLNVNNEIKQEIWLLATETSGPLVQRVSKNIMVVKCKVSPEHPLGYLHCSFCTTKLKDKVEYRFSCDCSAFKMLGKVNEEIGETTVMKICIHFYACICAFASDTKLTKEFQDYINLDQIDSTSPEELNFEFNEPNELIKMDDLNIADLENLTDQTHLLIFREDSLTVNNLQNDKLDIGSINMDSSLLTTNIVDNLKDQDYNLLDDTNIISEVQNLEVIDQNAVFDGSTIKIIRDSILRDAKFDSDISNNHVLNESIKSINGTMIKVLDPNLLLNTNTSNIKLIEPKSQSVRINGTNPILFEMPSKQKSPPLVKRKLEENKNLTAITNLNTIEPPHKKKMKITPIIKKYPNTCENVDESTTSLPFVRWLSSVTERINQTMHFQFDGKPEPLIFHAPQVFFECLRERISCGAKKKRMPNSTTAFVSNDAVPFGTFTKYTWHINNILHVKSIFETPLVPLEITRSFIHNADGTYDLYKKEETEIDRFKKTDNNPLIKPMELKTYLKVGNTSPNQVKPTPFLIEWIPDILPISKIGEMRIRFEFGHATSESAQKLMKLPLSKHY